LGQTGDWAANPHSLVSMSMQIPRVATAITIFRQNNSTFTTFMTHLSQMRSVLVADYQSLKTSGNNCCKIRITVTQNFSEFSSPMTLMPRPEDNWLNVSGVLLRLGQTSVFQKEKKDACDHRKSRPPDLP
jgi:hypothetical protein